jgi:NAD(P)-dependent dehydrogenase (short-subunit alcohol dehydrogenase family)
LRRDARAEGDISRFTTPYGFQTTADEIVADIELPGDRMVITGAASGIGIETARSLARTGASITLAVRDTLAGEAVAQEIVATTGNPLVEVRPLDLSSRASIEAFARGWSGPLHLLINNAGVMALPEQHTTEGWEMQFAINHLGHFYLTLGLLPALTAARGARLVVVSSSAHQNSPVVFDDIHFRRRPYTPISAYGQSKTANILFAIEANRRWAEREITANALMPGAIPTRLQRHLGGMKTPVELRKTPQQGAATSVLLAVSDLLEGIGGRYFADCNEAELIPESVKDMAGVYGYALDPVAASRLWELSLELLDAGGWDAFW